MGINKVKNKNTSYKITDDLSEEGWENLTDFFWLLLKIDRRLKISKSNKKLEDDVKNKPVDM